MREHWSERVDRLLAEGRPWRAKEVLRGNIGVAGYDRELYRRYAELLQRLGEELEAGKYYLLAGVVDGGAESAVRLYRHRNRNASAQQIFQEFPAGARVGSWDELSAPAAQLLQDRGLERSSGSPGRVDGEVAGAHLPWLLAVGCGTAAVLALLSGGVGAFVILRWLFRLVVGPAG